MEWTKSKTLKLLELLQKYPCLWNNNNNDYKNQRKRRDSLEHLAQEMGTNANAIEKKIICLKTQYNRELKKIKANKSAQGFNEVCNWYAFEQMHFFKDKCVPKRNVDLVKITDDYKKGVATVIKNCSSNILTNSTTQEQEQVETQVTKNSDKIENGSQKGVSYPMNEIDEFSLFGEAIACVLREIKSERELLKLKMKIMNLVYETKLNILDAANARAKVINKIENDEENKIEVIVDGKWLEDTEIT